MSLPVFVIQLDGLHSRELLQVEHQQIGDGEVTLLAFTFSRKFYLHQAIRKCELAVAAKAIIKGHVAIGVTLGRAGSLEILVEHRPAQLQPRADITAATDLVRR